LIKLTLTQTATHLIFVQGLREATVVDMGCLVSTPNDSGGNRFPKNVGEIMVFVPGLRIPKPVDFVQPLGDGLTKNLIERLSALRTRIVVMAGQEAPRAAKPRRTATQHGLLSLWTFLRFS
jgi:hypothetical protein